MHDVIVGGANYFILKYYNQNFPKVLEGRGLGVKESLFLAVCINKKQSIILRTKRTFKIPNLGT